MKQITILLPFLLVHIAAFTQSPAPQVVSSAGGYYQTSGISLSVTIGEMTMVQTFSGINAELTQGFQQSFGGAVLPVTLLSFTAMLIDKETHLEWQTVQETNNDHFDVQRSANGKDFETFTEVKAAGYVNSIQTYHAVDLSPYPGIGYYRLKQVDINGNFNYSRIVSIDLETGFTFFVYPNPVADRIRITINAPSVEKIQLDLYDITGRLVRSRELQLVQGGNYYEWDIRDLTKGAYFIRPRTEKLPVVKILKL